jgi:hypothetical protein
MKDAHNIATLEIDEDSDGTVDEKQVMESKAKRVYLPPVVRSQ